MVAAEQVDVVVNERGKPLDVGVLGGVAARAELGEGGVEVTGVPQHDGVEDEDEAEGAELVLLAFPVTLAELAALAVEDLASEGVTGFGAVELGEDAPPVGLVTPVTVQVRRTPPVSAGPEAPPVRVSTNRNGGVRR